MCKYKNCPKAEEEYKKTGYCIFHCDKEKFTEKEIKKFKDEFWKYFEEQEKDKIVKKLDFVGFEFPKTFSFDDGLKFKKLLDFRDVVFNDDLSFVDAVFNGGVDFTTAGFNGKVDFQGAIFRVGAIFRWVTFSCEARFLDATFECDAHFEMAKFKDKSNFRMAKFNGGAIFAETSFRGTDFEMTNFAKDAEFKKVVFEDDAKFRYTTFNGDTNFNETKFYRSVEFVGHSMKITVSMYGSRIDNWDENQVFLKNSHVNFSDSNFEHPEKVQFVNVDLSKASFLHCKDIDKIGRFEKIKWAQKGKFSKRKAIYDEIKTDKPYVYIADKPYEYDVIANKPYEFIAEIYRKLRLNYEHNLRFSEAGDFYIGEMEMRRKNVKLFGREIKNRILNLISRNISLIAWYRNFSYYGENYFLPVVWMFAITLGFAFYYYSPADFFTGFDIHGINASNFLESWKTSIMILFQMPPEQMTFSIFIERILGVLFVALFVLALRRKFKKGGE
ncbi:hypothetical protein BEH94_08600 [Candidatus Altiarchaeales archaeon WOR_SM1_SCG]|nr:hypothetical protein BEH94_08600 [Candidatus Altiarchaeales archaeon WOR_SM1_SCG]